MIVMPPPILAPIDSKTYVTDEVWRQWFQQVTPKKGFWTPVVKTSAGTLTYTYAQGRSFVHGDLVTLSFSVALGSISGMPHTPVTISGIPKELISSVYTLLPVIGYNCSYTGQLFGSLSLPATEISLWAVNGGAATQLMADAFLTASSSITGTAVYSLT